MADQLRAEAKRLDDGWTYEPPTFYDINSACHHRFGDEYAAAEPCRTVLPRQAELAQVRAPSIVLDLDVLPAKG